MFVQILVNAYLIICFGMIIFNIITAMLSRRRSKRSLQASKAFEENISQELKCIEETGAISQEHLRYMERKLRKVNNMMAFDVALENMREKSPRMVNTYLKALEGVIITIAEDYCRRDEIEAAYFPYIIKKYGLLSVEHENRVLEELLLDMLLEPSIYCRENAMQAIYTSGNPKTVVKALQIIDSSSLYYSRKILADGMLNFAGDSARLAEELWQSFDKFQIEMQLTILSYFRFSTGAFCERIHNILNEATRDDEIRFECLRYFGRYPYMPVFSDLLRYATPKEGIRWEYSAIASSALAIYPGEETVAVLKRNLNHPNWYIRFNASKSLEQMGLGYLELIDIIEGNDRYAAEILRYRLGERELVEKGKEERECSRT